ncbi:MAG: hypothetical protein Q9172_004949 [Xanthocarpia lactea]
MSESQWEQGNLSDNQHTLAPDPPPKGWPTTALSREASQAEHPPQSNSTTGDAFPKEGPGEALHLERADEEHADEDDEDHGEDGDEDQGPDTVSDGDSVSDSEGSENESCESESPEPCECGYVSHESDDGSEYGCFGHRSEDDGFSRSYRHYITCRANKEPFPLEKVPPEVRHMIFRLAMPDDRFEPLHESEHDWNDPYDGRILGFDGCGNPHEGYIFADDDDMEGPTKPQAIPNSLFEVRGFIANEALAVFYNEVYFRMDISPFGIRTRDHLTDPLKNFENHEKLAKWTEFETRRKYHLNIKSNAVRWSGGSGVYQDPSDYQHGSYRIKEWIRLVSDELLTKNIIQTLIITAPCKCALKAADLLPKDEASIFDLFTPLKRIHVPNPFILSLHNDRRKTGIENPCSEPACLQLTHNIQAHLGRLDGEPLSKREATWKDCKMRFLEDAKLEKKAPRNMDLLHGDLYSRIESVWETLSGIQLWETTFEEAMQSFRERLVEREQKREERREQKPKEEQKKKSSEEQENEQS